MIRLCRILGEKELNEPSSAYVLSVTRSLAAADTNETAQSQMRRSTTTTMYKLRAGPLQMCRPATQEQASFGRRDGARQPAGWRRLYAR